MISVAISRTDGKHSKGGRDKDKREIGERRKERASERKGGREGGRVSEREENEERREREKRQLPTVLTSSYPCTLAFSSVCVLGQAGTGDGVESFEPNFLLCGPHPNRRNELHAP